MNDFDGHPYAAPVKPGENNTTRLRNVPDTDLWGLVLPKTVNEALGTSGCDSGLEDWWPGY